MIFFPLQYLSSSYIVMTDERGPVSRANQNKNMEYNYFKAEYLGWNGSRSRVIAEVSGCWDTEDDAQDALNERVEKVRQDWYDRAGQDAETADDTHGGWLSDYRSFTYRFRVTPTVNGRLDHDRSLWVNPGELPDWKIAE
jgi:hypothetical protein